MTIYWNLSICPTCHIFFLVLLLWCWFITNMAAKKLFEQLYRCLLLASPKSYFQPPIFFLFQGFHIEFDRLARLSVLSVLWLFNVHIIPTIFYIYYIYIIYYMIYSKHLYTGLPLKLEKNMIFWRKIVIFHTKYRNNFRVFLRSVEFF